MPDQAGMQWKKEIFAVIVWRQTETGLALSDSASSLHSSRQNVNVLFPRLPLLTLLLALCLACSGLLGCGSGRVQPNGAASFEPAYTDGSYYQWVRDLLYEQFHGWKAVDYRYGGLSKRGVDCSGFVYLTYLRKFRVRIPRTTDRQLRSGDRVAFSELRPGDLLFFDTGWNKTHVGIYLENGRFLHSSKSQGVTISRLQNGYWAKRHFRSIRILAGM